MAGKIQGWMLGNNRLEWEPYTATSMTELESEVVYIYYKKTEQWLFYFDVYGMLDTNVYFDVWSIPIIKTDCPELTLRDIIEGLML